MVYVVNLEDPAAPGSTHAELRMAVIGENDTAGKLANVRPVGATTTDTTTLLYSPQGKYVLAVTVEYFGLDLDIWTSVYTSGLAPVLTASGADFELSDDLMGTEIFSACDQTALAAPFQAMIDADPIFPAGTLAQVDIGPSEFILTNSAIGWTDDDSFALHMQDSPALSALFPDGSVLPLIDEGDSSIDFYVTYGRQAGAWVLENCALTAPSPVGGLTPTGLAAITPAGEITLNGAILTDPFTGASLTGPGEPAERLDGPYQIP